MTPIETRGPFQHRTPVPIRDAAVTMFECSLSYEHLMGNVKDYLVSRIADLLADPIRFGSTALQVDRAVIENARMLTAAGWKGLGLTRVAPLRDYLIRRTEIGKTGNFHLFWQPP